MFKLLKKSIFLEGINKLEIKNDIVEIKKNNIVIKIDACGICSSDLKFIYSSHRIKKYPVILGHEIAGTIMQNDKKEGIIESKSRIVLGAEIPCGKCESCKKLRISNLCDNPSSVGSNFDGGFTNYIILKKNIFKKIPKIIYKSKNKIKYAALSESIACVLNGLETIKFTKKNTIAVIGAGYMGLLFVALSKILGAKKILVIDFDGKRLKIAKKLGAHNICKISDDTQKIILEKIYKINKTIYYDHVVSANSNIKSHELACTLVAKKGSVNLFGGVLKNKKIMIDPNIIHYKESVISGSFSSNINHLKKAFSIIKNNSINFSQIVSSYTNFKGFRSKITMLKKQKEIKSIFLPE
jgi:L-iditol 2-dehydrogenase